MKSHSFNNVFVLSVGNLSVGGTGKTPMVEYLIRFGLEQGWNMATLSRGYGRKTKGVLVANDKSSAADIGDESFGYFEQFGGRIKVVVAESRVEGMKVLTNLFSDVNVVILDDAFQHRSLKPNYSILLTTCERPFWNDFLLPSGRLREARTGHKRADCIVMTKCAENAAIFFPNQIDSMKAATGIAYGDSVLTGGEMKPKILAVAGIAKNKTFFDHLINDQFEVCKRLGFADHHMYSAADVDKIAQTAKEMDATVLCTYKDYVKLKSFDELENVSWGYVPIKVAFIEGEGRLKETLKTQFSLHTNSGMES